MTKSQITNRKSQTARLLLVHWPDGALAVIAAVRAHAMRCLRLVALRAEARRGRTKRIVSATFRRSCFGVSTFRIRHDSSLVQDSRVLPSPLSAASRGSSHAGAQLHVLVFKLVPH